MPHGFDNPEAVGMLPDIHPCGNSTEDKHCDSIPVRDGDKVIENLKEDDYTGCYIVVGLLLIALIIAIICKFREMY